MAISSDAISLTSVSYEYGGRKFTGLLAEGSGGERAPGVLVAHEGPGITDHIRRRTQEFAALGFVAFALDLYGVENPPIDQAMGFVHALRADLPELRGRAGAALTVLRSQRSVDHRRIAAIGFCFGGTAVLELARSGADIAGVVGFHAGLDTLRPEDAKYIRGPVLVCLGANDPIITEERRRAFADEMTKGGVDWQMHVYGGVGHSFTYQDIDAFGFSGFAYDAAADRRSWAAMRSFFAELFS